MLELCIIGYLRGVEVDIHSYEFDENLTLTSSKDKCVEKITKLLFKKEAKTSKFLSRHDKQLLRRCNACLLHYRKVPKKDYSDKYFDESDLLFIYLIEALRIIRPSLALALFLFECEKKEDGNFYPINHKTKRQPSNSIGLKKIIFEKNDLELAKNIFKKLRQLHSTPAKARNRLVHSVLLYNKAIFMDDLEVSYLMFVTLLECLFSRLNERGELRYSLSNNIAWFLAKNQEERADIFTNFNDIYKYRSKIVHGADVKPSLTEGIRNTIIDLRELCRKALEKIFHNEKLYDLFSGKKDNIDHYMRQLTLNIKH